MRICQISEALLRPYSDLTVIACALMNELMVDISDDEVPWGFNHRWQELGYLQLCMCRRPFPSAPLGYAGFHLVFIS